MPKSEDVINRAKAYIRSQLDKKELLKQLEQDKAILLEALKQSIKEVKDTVKAIRLPAINIPEIKVPKADPVIIPEIKLPTINVPEPKVTVNLPEIKVPKAEVTVHVKEPKIPPIEIPQINVPEVVMPKEMDVKMTSVTNAKPFPVVVTNQPSPARFPKQVDHTRQAVAYNGSVTVGATSTVVLAANGNRREVIFVNDSDETIYLSRRNTAVMNAGIRLNANGGALIDDHYTGEYYAICTSGSKNLTFSEV